LHSPALTQHLHTSTTLRFPNTLKQIKPITKPKQVQALALTYNQTSNSKINYTAISFRPNYITSKIHLPNPFPAFCRLL